MSAQLPLFGAPAANDATPEMETPRDVGLHLPLDGVRLIEASAGTGKTFTLTTLVLRLLLERGAMMAQILAVTFTRAATQELRQRVRRRLRLARRLLDAAPDVLQGEAVPTLAVLRAAIARDGEARVRERVEAALLQIDEATISTIHGFCHRALREFGFRAGLLAEQRVIDDPGEVWAEVAAEVWRAASNGMIGPDAIDLHPLLSALWESPDALAGDLPKLCDPLRAMHPQRDESEMAAALHALRDTATARYEALMARRGLCDQDRLIGRVWQASDEAEFAAALAARWPYRLIDEFQDTDPRQWDIFRRMHEAGEEDAPRWLCLIGDPKQAIYRFRGGDLATYLAAKRYAITRGGESAVVALGANYRSTPAVLRAIETVFTAHPLPFHVEGVAFQSVEAGGGARDDDLRLGDAAVPGMTLHWLPKAPHDPKGPPNSALRKGLRNKDDEFEVMRDAATHAVADLLARGSLRIGDGVRPLRPADIAVLTQTNDQAATMQRALTRAGIAAATLSGANVFSGDAAEDLHALLASLLEPADGGRFRAALSTRLLGLDAAAIHALDADVDAQQAWLARFAEAADTWRQRGPLPALLPFVVDAAPRWLAEADGQRRLTDTLHLAELLQAESALRTGAAEQVHWFARQRVDATHDETRQLRLESDAGMVQIVTIHKSKGLEYPVVVLPFAAWRSEPPSRGLVMRDFHDAQGRPARAWSRKDVLEPAQAEAIAPQVRREEQAELQRQLYVALTRAAHALHVVWSRNAQVESTALHWILHSGEQTGRAKDTLDYAGMQARIEQLAAGSDGSIVVRPFDPAVPLPRPARERDAAAAVPPRAPARALSGGLRLHSFSSLHARSEDGESARGAGDESLAAVDAEADDATLGGTSFGNAVHAALEEADASAWRRGAGDDEDQAPASQRVLLERALRRQGLAVTPSHLAQTSRLVSRALNVALPGGVRLCDWPSTSVIRELPFHFRLRPLRIDALHALLQANGYPRARRPVAGTLDGLMHGYVDLVYRDAHGRHHVLDYKTNRLPAYDPESLRRAVQLQDYDLQYLIYLVALRRWLRLRHGDAYDDARHLGGAVYLFLRGIDLPGEDAADAGRSRRGVHVDPVDPALLAALDAFFDGEGGAR
ncbi:MAG: UvrD-helicase domain-containing protein [Lysobacter sp.]|nr:UvrD-helicase domain-containing protein [Lysobacter sp.]